MVVQEHNYRPGGLFPCCHPQCQARTRI